jgi:hypothetical protein
MKIASPGILSLFKAEETVRGKPLNLSLQAKLPASVRAANSRQANQTFRLETPAREACAASNKKEQQ